MEACSLTALIPTVDQVKTGLSILGSVVIAASTLVSMTPTPKPGTPQARLYRYLEWAALLFGRAKETGLLPPTRGDKAISEAVELVRGSR